MERGNLATFLSFGDKSRTVILPGHQEEGEGYVKSDFARHLYPPALGKVQRRLRNSGQMGSIVVATTWCCNARPSEQNRARPWGLRTTPLQKKSLFLYPKATCLLPSPWTQEWSCLSSMYTETGREKFSQERLRLNLATSFVAGGDRRENTVHGYRTWTPSISKQSLEIWLIYLTVLPQAQPRKSSHTEQRSGVSVNWVPWVWSLLDLCPFQSYINHQPSLVAGSF